MNILVQQVSKNRLGGESCPKDLEILITQHFDILEDMGVEINGEESWAPWADKSYLTEADYRNPDIVANVKAIDDTFTCIRFVARTDDDECIGYWCGPEGRAVSESPLVYYDTEGCFRLCGTRFVESLFFLSYDENALARLRAAFASLGTPLEFNSLDDIVIPVTGCSPESYHDEKYRKYKGV